MALEENDLWPDNIGQNVISTPVSIMKKQAERLGSKTRNLVEAEVNISPSNQNFTITFDLKAPLLDYRYRLFTMIQPIELYPLQVAMGPVTPEMRASKIPQIANETELIAYLKAVFSYEKTINIINALISQSSA